MQNLAKMILLRSTCSLLAVCLAFAAPAALAAESGGAVVGRVLGSDGATPIEDVVVYVYQPDGELRFASAPTGPHGGFRVDRIPAGEYAVLAEGSAGVYLASSNLSVREGDNDPLRIRLADRAEPVIAPGQSKPGLPKWVKGTIAGLLIFGGAYLYEEVGEDVDETVGSPF